MYLFDINIFLEILLSQEKSDDCKKVLSEHIGYIAISDFTLHSIGVILFRQNKEQIFNNFISDVLPKVDMVSLSSEAYKKLSELKDIYALDFDDAYQCKIAEEKGLTIFTMDNDFRRAKNVEVKFI